MEQVKKTSGSVHSVAKAMELMLLLQKEQKAMSLAELCAKTGYPKSTAHALLSTLREYHMIEQHADGNYWLGLQLVQMGITVSNELDILKLAGPYMDRLSEGLDGSVYLSYVDGDSVISIDQKNGSGDSGLQIALDMGKSLPLHATAQGKLFLSTLSDDQAERVLKKQALLAYTPHTITDIQQLLEHAKLIRSNGYALEDGEYKIGLRSIAAPVYDQTGKMRYILGIVGLFRRITSDDFLKYQQRLLNQTVELSKALGWQKLL